MLEGKFTGNVTAADYLVDFEQIGITAMSADGQDWVPLLGIIGIIMPAFQSVETVFPAILEGAKQSETSFLVAGLRILSMFRDMFVLLDVLHSRGAYHGVSTRSFDQSVKAESVVPVPGCEVREFPPKSGRDFQAE